jgi:hypothetical protein
MAFRGLLATGRPVGMLVLFIGACAALQGCEPTVKVEAPKEPITINLNIKVDAEVRVKLEEAAKEDIEDNPDLF